MAKAGMYRLTPKSIEDMDEIWRCMVETWSLEKADEYVDALVGVFSLIAASPLIAREYAQFKPPVRIFIHQTHLIVYLVQDDHVQIVSVLGARQDWLSILKDAEK